MASGVVKVNVDGRIVHADGKLLPRAIPGTGGIAKILKDEMSNRKGTSSVAEVDYHRHFVSNYEFAVLDNAGATYTAIPAQRVEKNKDERTQPYRRPDKDQKPAQKAPPPKKLVPIVEIQSVPKTILKREMPAVIPHSVKRGLYHYSSSVEYR
jgi:hypothetical protein